MSTYVMVTVMNISARGFTSNNESCYQHLVWPCCYLNPGPPLHCTSRQRLILCSKDGKRSSRERFIQKVLPLRANWRTIGCRLGIVQSELDVIDKDNRGQSGECFMAVLDLWLKTGDRRESELDQAVASEKALARQNNALCVILIASLFVAIISIMLGYLYFNAKPLATTDTLKDRYKHLPVVEFKLLGYADDIPFLNVSVKKEGSLIESSQFFHDIDFNYASNKQRNGPRVLIAGHPGAGKTTLLRHLAKEWAEGNALQSCQILFLIHLDRLSKERKPQSLKDLLELTPHNDLKDIKQVSEEIQNRSGAGACFLLDSYDGWSWTGDYVHSLIFENTLPSSLCVLTSRPFKLDESNIHYVEIVGFNASHLEEYLYTLADGNIVKSILMLWGNDNNTREMCQLPLHMVMLIYIAKQGGNLSVKTKTQVYIAFMNVTIKHFANHHPDWNTVSLKHCILEFKGGPSDELCAAFHNLTYVAYKILFNKVDKFPEYPNVVRNINKLGFVNVTKPQSTDDQVKYTFYHPTFIEYYAAIHLLKLSNGERFFIYVKEWLDSKQFYVNPQIWVFFFGLLGEHYGTPTSTSIVLRLFNTYCYTTDENERPMPRLPNCCCGILEYIHEIRWTGEGLHKLLGSVGVLVNKSLCFEYVYNFNELYGMKYLLNYTHATFHLFNVGPYYRYFMFEKNKRHILDTPSIAPLDMCMYTPSNITADMASLTTVQLHFDIHDSEPLLLTRFDCTVKTSIKLSFLHVGLEGLNIEQVQKALTSVISHSRSLQTLSLSVELRYSQLPVLVSKLNELQNNITLKLKLNLTCESGYSLHPNVSDGPFDVLNNRLEKLVLVFSNVSFEQCHVIFLHNATGLKHLSISLDEALNHNNDTDDLLNELATIKTLESLEIQHYQIGGSKINVLLELLPPTLLELKLHNSGLTDRDVQTVIIIRSTHQLTSLSLRNNNITGTGLLRISLSHLNHSLHKLDLSGNPISVKGMATFVELTNLRELNLSNCSIADEEIKALVDAIELNTNLYSLNLSQNPFIGSTGGLEQLARLKNVHRLDISGWSLKSDHTPQVKNEVSTDAEYEEFDKSKAHSKTLSHVLKQLTQLRHLTLCTEKDAPIYWSEEMAGALSSLPELQIINAPCLIAS